MSKWVNNAGEICKSKDGDSHYIKVQKDFKVLKGNTIRMVSFREHLQGLVDADIISKEEMDSRLKKVNWVKHVLHIPPQEFKEKDESESKNGWINDAFEIRKSKQGNFYIAVLKDFDVMKDQNISLQKFSDKIESLYERGLTKSSNCFCKYLE